MRLSGNGVIRPLGRQDRAMRGLKARLSSMALSTSSLPPFCVLGRILRYWLIRDQGQPGAVSGPPLASRAVVLERNAMTIRIERCAMSEDWTNQVLDLRGIGSCHWAFCGLVVLFLRECLQGEGPQRRVPENWIIEVVSNHPELLPAQYHAHWLHPAFSRPGRQPLPCLADRGIAFRFLGGRGVQVEGTTTNHSGGRH